MIITIIELMILSHNGFGTYVIENMSHPFIVFEGVAINAAKGASYLPTKGVGNYQFSRLVCCRG